MDMRLVRTIALKDIKEVTACTPGEAEREILKGEKIY